MLQGELTDDQLQTVQAKLDELALLFDYSLALPRRALYVRTILNYSGFMFTFDDLLRAFAFSFERFDTMPSAKAIIETIDRRH